MYLPSMPEGTKQVIPTWCDRWYSTWFTVLRSTHTHPRKILNEKSSSQTSFRTATFSRFSEEFRYNKQWYTNDRTPENNGILTTGLPQTMVYGWWRDSRKQWYTDDRTPTNNGIPMKGPPEHIWFRFWVYLGIDLQRFLICLRFDLERFFHLFKDWFRKVFWFV